MKPQQRLTVILFYLLVLVGVIIAVSFLLESEEGPNIYLLGAAGFLVILIIFVNLNTWMRRANRRVAKNRKKLGINS
jgi:O-antigen/teichoic acid export membrane protein